MTALDRSEVSIEGLSKPTAHFSDAVRHNGLCYFSGLLALDGEGRLVGGEDVSRQATQIMTNMAIGLKQVGSDFSQLLKINVYLTSMADRVAFDAVRRAFFGETKPASTLVEVSALAVPGARIEIEAIAIAPFVTGA